MSVRSLILSIEIRSLNYSIVFTFYFIPFHQICKPNGQSAQAMHFILSVRLFDPFEILNSPSYGFPDTFTHGRPGYCCDRSQWRL